MPEFRFHGPDRYYPSLGLHAKDKTVHTFDKASPPPQDGRWTEVHHGGDDAPAKTERKK